MNSWAVTEGQPGLGYIFFRDDGEGAGPIAKNIGPERTESMRERLKLGDGDAVFFVCGVPSKFVAFAGAARQRVGCELKLVDENRFDFCWIVDFPMFEWKDEEKKIDFSHNPFSMPNYPHNAFLELDPDDKNAILEITAFQYDIVCNGIELSSGAIRNHLPEIMRKAFRIAGYGDNALEQQFGGMLRALIRRTAARRASPGIDRIVMLLCDEQELREVTLFPMNQRAEDLMMGAPSGYREAAARTAHPARAA
jgi:aspartyl-tRNA synthetase